MKKEEKQKNNKKFIIVVLLLLCFVGVGYAALSKNIDIIGLTTIKGTHWNVVYNNVVETSGSVTPQKGAVVEGDQINFEVTLNNPGDYYEFTFDAKNQGDIDAKLSAKPIIYSKVDNVTTQTLPTYLDCKIVYASDNSELAANDDLLKTTTKKIKVRVEFKTNINEEDLPAQDQTVTLSIPLNYEQK